MIMNKRFVGLMLAVLQLGLTTVKAQEVMETGGAKPMPAQWIDSKTGHKVVRLVNRESDNGSFYFNNTPFVPQIRNEGDVMVFYGKTDKGEQLFTVNLKTQKIDQLTNRTKVSGEMVCAKTREAFYQSGDSIFAVNVNTHKMRFIYAFAPDFKGRVGTVNADFIKAATAYSL